ncbi:hypothetical protein M2284_003454 [Rhodococcus sp. LBL1]|nr:hypothetical protein [Rhodococcus sp. LBL1]MDH6685022.1 hypothetical protein [Rhodococcus sp. LBL2]
MFTEFATRLLEEVRPKLSVETQGFIAQDIADGQMNQAVMQAIIGVADEHVAISPGLHAEIVHRIRDGASFRRKDAGLLERYIPELSVASSA